MAGFLNALRQVWPPKPQFTEKDLPDLSGKVYIVTGANTGVGKELAQILYAKHAKVYVAARSEEKAKAAIDSIKSSSLDSKGALALLHLDLADLTTIKKSATDFLSQETKLHVLFNNAGVMTPPQGSKSAQGYELQLGVNNLGTFLFTKLLTPALASTARDEPPGSVRVVWVSSSAAEHFSHTPGGVDLENLNYEKRDLSAASKYGTSKAGNYLHAAEFARRHRDDGIVSVSLNPGNLNTELSRHRTTFEKWFLQTVVQYPPIMGAYTELFAGLSPLVSVEKSGDWIAPWGRFVPIRQDLLAASKPESEGGTGTAEKWWGWTEEQVKPYL